MGDHPAHLVVLESPAHQAFDSLARETTALELRQYRVSDFDGAIPGRFALESSVADETRRPESSQYASS